MRDLTPREAIGVIAKICFIVSAIGLAGAIWLVFGGSDSAALFALVGAAVSAYAGYWLPRALD